MDAQAASHFDQLQAHPEQTSAVAELAYCFQQGPEACWTWPRLGGKVTVPSARSQMDAGVRPGLCQKECQSCDGLGKRSHQAMLSRQFWGIHGGIGLINCTCL